MSSDNQFTALGPAIIGFQTNGTNIDTGAVISGNQAGVEAHGNIGHGVHATSDLNVGVFAEVSHVETPAIVGKAGGQDGIGVVGQATNLGGDGVMGISELGHGGVFESRRSGLAQVRLSPQEAKRLPRLVGAAAVEYGPDEMMTLLPNRGRRGDLLLMGDDGHSALWLCVGDTNGSKPVWQQLLLGTPVRGDAPIDLSTPIDNPRGKPGNP